MGSIKIRYGLIGVVCVLLAIVASLGVIGLRTASRINDNVVNLATHWLPSVRVTSDIKTNIGDLRIAQGSHVMTSSEEDMARADKDIQDALLAIEKNRKAYEALISSDEERRAYDVFAKNFDVYIEMQKKLLDLTQKNEDEAAIVYLKSTCARFITNSAMRLLG